MSTTYKYTDKDGDQFAITNNCPDGYISIRVTQDSEPGAAYIANADAPTVAAELLKAAGQEGVFVPKSAERVEPDENYITCGSGPEKAYGDLSQNPNWLWNCAANYIALAEYIENKAQRETEAATKLQERRDALSFQLTGSGDTAPQVPYANRTVPMRKAIDRIIALEDGK